MRSVALVSLGLALAGCHLAASPDPPKCDAGSHANNGHCELDVIDGPTVTITAGSACGPMPASIKVPPNGPFRFQNDDAVDHVIAGADGQTWATAKANQASPFVGITRVGSWPYTVSGCSAPGVVIVE